MSRIIKRADLQQDAVVVGNRRSTPFLPADFRDSQTPQPAAGEDVAGQRGRLETARSQAERILAEARSQALAITREAMARGYADGKAEGLREAAEMCRGYLERIAELARRATVDRYALVHSAEKETAALALAIAAKVIRREIHEDASVVLSIVQAALEKAVPGDSVRILVHPDDVDLLQEKWAELRGATLFGHQWEVAGDDRIERGGCFIETRSGSVDARIDAQLGHIAAAFEVQSWTQ